MNENSLSRRDVLAGGITVTATLALPSGLLAQSPVLARTIPHSGEMLPVIGTGSAIIYDYKDDAAKQAERRQALEALVNGGARLVDTAPSYGMAEDRLGEIMAEAGLRDKIFLATKVAVRAPAEQAAEMQASLAKLKTAKVDLMQLHNPKDPATDLGFLREFKAKGLCRYIGITTSFPRDYDAVAAILKREKPDFFQVNYSLADRESEKELIPIAKDVGAAVLTALPFGRGNLFRLVRGKTVPDWAAEFGATSWGQFFLKFLLSNDAINGVIPGTDKAEYAVDNLNAGRGALPDAAMRLKMIDFIESLK